MDTALIQFRLPEDVKKRLQMLAENKGLSLATLLRMHAFELAKEVFPTESLEEYENSDEIVKSYKKSLDENERLYGKTLKDFMKK